MCQLTIKIVGLIYASRGEQIQTSFSSLTSIKPNPPKEQLVLTTDWTWTGTVSSTNLSTTWLPPVF